MTKINIYHGNSLNAMESMEDKKYGLAIADPPYGIGLVRTKNGNRGIRNKKVDNDILGWDHESPSVEYFSELFRISENQIIFGANNFISKMPYDTPCWLIWDCMNGKNYFADFQMAWTSFRTACRFIKVSQRFPKGEDIKIRIHDTQKPISIYKSILKNYGFNKDGSKRTIFDSHAGSMSLVIACIDMGFNIDCWEIDEDYYKDAVNRVKRHLAQLDLTREMVEINYIS